MKRVKLKEEKSVNLVEVLSNGIIAVGTKVLNIIFAILTAKITLSRVAAFFLILPLTLGLSGVGTTNAYFNDTESSTGNIFTAAFLDFFLSETDFDTFIGKEALGEYSVASVAIQTTGSLDIQYAVNVEKISGDDDFCDGLLLEVIKNGIEVHDADVFSFSGATSTVFGTWEFEYDLPPSVTTIGHGDECDFDIVYTGWRADSTPETSGFDDEERISFELTSKMIVMNEILPNPTGSDFQSGLLGEWVELYNNGDTSVDVAGWEISELSDPQGTPTEKFYTIVASSPVVGEVRTSSGSTVISAGGFLVIVFDTARLNNTGDTVTLYDGSSNQMDQHTYVSGETPENKSIARIPDGIGAWVDPIPTPGFANTEDESEITLALSSDAIDIEAPVINIVGNNPALIELGVAYNDLGATVTDNVNNNLGISVEGSEIDTSILGEYEVIYRATDQAGNTAEAVRTVIVYDPAVGPPVIIEGSVIEEVVAPEETPESPNLIEKFIQKVVEFFEPQPETSAEGGSASGGDEPMAQVVEETPQTSTSTEPVVESPTETSTSTEPLIEEEPVIEAVVEPVVEPAVEPVIVEETATSTEPTLPELNETEVSPLESSTIIEDTSTTTPQVFVEEPVVEETIEPEPVIVEEPIVEEPVVEEPPVGDPIVE